MSISIPDSKQQLWSEGSSIIAKFDRTSPNTATVSWTLPTSPIVYDGALVLLSTKELITDNLPLDQNRYNASQDLNAPGDNINGALVIGAFYGDKLTNLINLVNLVPNEIYYVSVHALTNTLEYYTNGSLTYVSEVKGASYSGDIPSYTTAPTSPVLGEVFYSRSTGKVSMWNGTVWISVNARDVIHGKEFPDVLTATIGSFFYYEINDRLYSFDGIQWNLTNTSNEGIPTYNKIGIGTDGSIDEIEGLIDTIKRDLGWPQTCVELDNIDFKKAVTKAIKEFRRRGDNAYRRRYIFLQLRPDRSTYYLNDPVSETDKVVEVIKVHRVNSLAILALGNNGIYAQQFINQFISPTTVDLVTVHLYSQMAEMITKIFAGDIEYTWNDSTRELFLLRRVYSDEKVLIEVAMERTKQELLLDRYIGPWLEDWARTECLYKLGMVRGKFASLPGPGGVSLNGSELLTMAGTEFEELRRQITDWEVGGGGVEFGSTGILLG